MARRPMGVRRVITCLPRNRKTGQNSRALQWSRRTGICPGSRPAKIVGWLAATSYAMSVPECDAPTTSTGPGLSCVGRRYSLECNCRIEGSRSSAKSGMLGVRPKVPVATTTLSATSGHLRAGAGTFRRSLAAGRRGRASGPEARTVRRTRPDSRRPGPWSDKTIVNQGTVALAGRRITAGEYRRSESQWAAPVVADPGVAIDDQARPATPPQVIRGREAGLAGPDDRGLDVVDRHGNLRWEKGRRRNGRTRLA